VNNNFGQPQTVVVLGGSSDIARAITKRLCVARAHTVVLAGRNEELLDEAASEARRYGATKAATVLFDAEDVSSAQRAVDESFDQVGEDVDLVIIAVGQHAKQRTYEDDATRCASVAVVNYAWPVAALAQIRRRLVAQGHGRILVMSSAAAIRVRRSTYLCDSAKAGLDRLCVGLAQSLEGTGVRLQILRPGYVRSRMTAGRKERPLSTGVDEVAENTMRGLASDDLAIWSPPVLRYAFAVAVLLPPGLWRRVTADDE
jgi:decaprenylphospho-beta-D-erythro-pentofuranosid-2-ulose 2-reductase